MADRVRQAMARSRAAAIAPELEQRWLEGFRDGAAGRSRQEVRASLQLRRAYLIGFEAGRRALDQAELEARTWSTAEAAR